MNGQVLALCLMCATLCSGGIASAVAKVTVIPQAFIVLAGITAALAGMCWK